MGWPLPEVGGVQGAQGLTARYRVARSRVSRTACDSLNKTVFYTCLKALRVAVRRSHPEKKVRNCDMTHGNYTHGGDPFIKHVYTTVSGTPHTNATLQVRDTSVH